MPRFEPFPGLRYDAEIAPLAEAIAPPYDVVDDAERARFADRSPYNAIHVELPVPDEEHGLDRYAHASALLESWQRAGALRADDAPCLYVYRMTYNDEAGGERTTIGVVGALGLDVVGGSHVLPHERTMPKPKGDRLELLRATKTNLSPIWGLSLAPGLAAACRDAIGELPASMHATDEEGVAHDLWPISEPSAIAEIAALVSSTPVVIADGHHRYETATFYQSECRAQFDQDGPYDLMMAFIVELSEQELVVRPTHRVLNGLPEEVDLPASLETLFEVRPFEKEIGEIGDAMRTLGALGLVLGQRAYLLVPKDELLDQAEADLDSSRLDVALAALPAHEIRYQHGTLATADTVRAGVAQAAFLLRPATVEQIKDTAHSGRRMPPKTTFFHPKPRTGLVFRSMTS